MTNHNFHLLQSMAATLIVLLLALAGCHQESRRETAATTVPAAASNDNTIYGLACEGSNDTIIIFLREPYTGANPDTLSVLRAMQSKQVFGKINTGDRLAIMKSQEDSTEAELVIVTERLLGTWCYLQKPMLRQRADMEGMTEEQVLESLPDSVRQLLETALEYGFTLKIDSMALPIWHQQQNTGTDSPIEYPPIKLYRQWCINNGHLLLIQSITDSAGVSQFIGQDTAILVMLKDDSLVLNFGTEQQSYYRKHDSTE